MFKNILIPTDGSEQSQRAVRTGVELAKLHGARVTGIHVIPDYHLLIAYEGAFDPVTEERIEEEAKARADTYLGFIRDAAARGRRRRARRCARRATTRTTRSCAPATPTRCDLILMTSHGRKGLAAVLLGSETRKVLTHAKVPVLVVR